jgi:hypothetical protein
MDAQAVDLLLDGNGQFDGNDTELKQHLDAAQRVLGLLNAMPPVDGPSTNLIDLTLQRVQDAAERATPVGDAAQEGVFVPPTGLRAS